MDSAIKSPETNQWKQAISIQHREEFERNSIVLPKWWPNKASKSQSRKENGTSNNHNPTTQTSTTTRSRASFVTSRFTCSSVSRDEYDDCFRLDGCADTHVCNNLSRSTRYEPLHNEIIRFRNTDTQIEGIGKVTVHVKTPTGSGIIQRDNVAWYLAFIGI